VVNWAGGDKIWARASGLSALLIGLLLLSQGLGLLQLDLAAIRGAAPDKTMLMVLQDPGYDGRIVETVWGPFARLDLVETSDPDVKLVFTDGGAGSYMLRYDGNPEQLASLRQDPEYLPFTLGQAADTLIVGAGAGKDVLLALLAGSTQVTAVEINPDMVALTRRYAGYNGGILDAPGVETHVADGRSFIERDPNQYDLIYMNLVYSQAARHEGAALAESYIFTEEALRTYWQHLKPGGRIGLITHNGFEGSRALLTAIAALQAEGLTLRQALDRVILYQYGSGDPLSRTSVLLITRDYLDEAQLAANTKQADALGLQMVYVPILFELPLRDLVVGDTDVYTFARNGDYNLSPTSDDRPFFYQLNWELPGALVFLVVLMAVVVLAYAGAISRIGHKAGAPPAWLLAGYFALLGAAFMLVQLPLVQRFYLLLGNPVLALVVTLEGLLAGAALGSLLSDRRRHNLVQMVTLAGAGAIALLLIYALLYPMFRGALLQASLPWRLAAILVLTAPLGMLLGIPFPTGLRLTGQWLPSATPALWGLNAVAAVLGSALAAAGAITFGFQAMLLLAAGLYAAALLLLNGAGRAADSNNRLPA
jgi:SAM-dependent methyltransferase